MTWSSHNWSVDANIIWDNLKSMIPDACTTLVPRYSGKRRKHPKWFNPEAKHLLNCTRTARKKFKRSPTLGKQRQLETLENQLGLACTSAKSHYLQHLVDTFSSNPKALYSHIAEIKGRKSDQGMLIMNGVAVTDPTTRARIFNEFFHSTFSVSSFALPPLDEMPTPSAQLSSIIIDTSDVYQALTNLDPTKAAGCDAMPPRLLRHCATSLTDPVTHLFFTSLQTGTLPEEWIIHKITPVPKGGCKTDPTNYRPISLLCILSKVPETIVCDKIKLFIRPLLSPQQFGFLESRSCLTG